MIKKVSDREKLNREVKALDDDQVREVLEYISIMKSLREQEVNPRQSTAGVTKLLSHRENFHHPLYGGQEGDVLVFPRARRAASK